MPSHLLDWLPREIRDQTYVYVLGSPTGLVILPTSRATRTDRYGWRNQVDCFQLVPFDSERNFPLGDESKIKLSLLRVCRQIHAECENLLWQLNGIRLQRPNELRSLQSWDSLAKQLAPNLQYIEMDFELFQPRYFLDTQRALETFVEWSRNGSLKGCTLRFPYRATRHNGGGTPFEIVLGLRRMSRQWRSVGTPSARDCHNYLDLLKKCGSIDGFPSHVKTKLIVNTGFMSRTPSEKEEWLDNWLRLDPSGFMAELNNFFGGELWMDGVLCYKEGLKVKDPFEDELELVTEEESIENFEVS